MTPPAQLAAALAPLTARVRADVTAAKSQDGAQAWTRQPLTQTRLIEHVSGGIARGVSQIPAGDDRTRVAVLDFDSHGGEVDWDRMSAIVTDVIDACPLFDLEPVAWRSSGGRGVHLYFVWDEPQDAYSVRQHLVELLDACGLRNGTKGLVAGEVEVFPKQNSVHADGFGNQVVLPLAGRSVPLVWEDLAGGWSPGSRDDAVGLKWPASAPVPVRERPVPRVRQDGPLVGHAELQELLGAIPNEGGLELGYDEWFRTIAAIHHETGGSDEGLRLAHDFSSKADGKYDASFLDERVWPFIRSDGRDSVVGIGTLRRMASGFGWHEALDPDGFDDVSAGDDRPPMPYTNGHASIDLAAPVAQDATLAQGMGLVSRVVATAPPPMAPIKRGGIPEAQHLTTDQANANRLVNAFGRQVLVAAGRWHVWDGRRWLADEADVYRYGCQLSELIRSEAAAIKARASVLPDLAAQAKAAAVAEALMKWAMKSEMKGTIEAAIGLARKMLTVDAADLDRDPWALNCVNGIVDLRTGGIRPHDPDELITKLCPVAYDPAALSPVWEAMLRGVTRGDETLLGFLGRWFGYCTTGVVTEQAFVVHWGSGSNGKSTVLDTVAEVLGDYAGVAAPGLLMASRGGGDRHPTEIAALMGRRMVTAHESGEGVVLREDFIKQATGGDKLTARFMREDFFAFDPTHKLQLLTNHKPSVRGQDQGIWRRVLLVPYVASFGTAEEVARGERTGVRDLGLVERLRGELPGVLAWLVRGCLQWREGGLQAPAVVLAASAAYKSEQDRVGQFVGECCERGPIDGPDMIAEPLTDGMGGLYPAYVAWCKESGIMPLSKQRFADDALRVTGAGGTVERKSPVENGKRRKLSCIPGLALLSEG